MKQTMNILGLLLLLLCGPSDTRAEKMPPTGMGDIDILRKEVIASATDAGHENSRRAALLRWWRLMWRRASSLRNRIDLAN